MNELPKILNGRDEEEGKAMSVNILIDNNCNLRTRR